MWFQRMSLEVWFDRYQYEVKYDIGESAVKFHTFENLNINLGSLPLRYGFHMGRPDLREKLAEQYPGFTGDNIIVTSGASEANFAIVSAVAMPGDHIVVEHPNYSSMYEVPKSLGCEVSFLELEYDTQFKPDLQKLEDLIRPETKLVSLTHPNNPAGSMVSEDTLNDIIKIVEKNDVYLLFDETYRDLAFEEILPAAASLSPKVISISSMSKIYGLPGIRIGWAATQDTSILDSMLAIREQVSITNNAMSEEVAVSVLARKDEFLERSKAHVARNLKTVTAWMDAQEDFEWVPPEAGVVSLPRLKESVPVDPEDLWIALAEKYKTFIIPGRCFEIDNHYFRLGFGATNEEIVTGLANIEKAMNDLK